MLATGLVPADSDRLKSYVAVERTDHGHTPKDFEAFLAEHGIPLLEATASNTYDGDDPLTEGDHPSIKNNFRVGPITPAEAWWIFATYDGADWFPVPDSTTLPWGPGDALCREKATVKNPGKWESLLYDHVEVARELPTQRVTKFARYIRGEGGGTTRYMTRLDDTTWILKDMLFAD